MKTFGASVNRFSPKILQTFPFNLWRSSPDYSTSPPPQPRRATKKKATPPIVRARNHFATVISKSMIMPRNRLLTKSMLILS